MFSNAETLSVVTYKRCWRIFKCGNTQQFYRKGVGEFKNVETLSIATLKALGVFKCGNTQQCYRKGVGEFSKVETLSIARSKSLEDFQGVGGFSNVGSLCIHA